MIDPKELRIGNWVFDGALHQVEADDIPKYYYSGYPPRPIPLTEEWLVLLGWVWNEECKSYEKYPNGDARMNLQYRPVNGSYTMFNYIIKALTCERIFYVHQLQNLYFSLTGEELNY